LTDDGAIVVNGIVASVHSSFRYEGGGDYYEKLSLPAIKANEHYYLNKHQFQQLIYAPLRLLCKLSQAGMCGKKHEVALGYHPLTDVIEVGLVSLMPTFYTVKASKRGRFKMPDEIEFLTFDAFLPFKLWYLFSMIAIIILEYVFDNAARFFAAITAIAVIRTFKLRIKKQGKTMKTA
jgi:hypothetical protein